MPSAASSPPAPVEPVDPGELRLRSGKLVSLAPATGHGLPRGALDAVLQGPTATIKVLAQPALIAAPTAHRTTHAFYRLAHALGMRVVPVATVRRVPLAELGAAVGADREARTMLGTFRVQNDGAIDVLLTARTSESAGPECEATRGTPFNPLEGPQAATWDRWARAAQPEPGEDSRVLRDYLELLVLDYLAANGTRQSAMLCGTSAISLADNAAVFPAHVDALLVDRVLRHLRAAARFPRGLLDALRAFDRAAARRTFNGGAFEDWLLSPRMLVELDERRATLLTLIEARVAEHGAQAVLVL